MNHTLESPAPKHTALDKYGINAIARHMATSIFMSVLLFIGAGSLNWTWGWLFSIVYFLGWMGLNIALVRWNPELLNERGKRTNDMKGTKTWDWVLLILYSLLLLIQPLVAGLDWRNGWSAAASTVLYITGNVLALAALALLAWSMVCNRFFEGTVRIQEQRGHRVISSGPYQYVRHPGYVSVILTFVAMPLALGTWTALIPGAAGILIFIIRTALEDRTLQNELPGYRDFAQQTRYRLLPGIW